MPVRWCDCLSCWWVVAARWRGLSPVILIYSRRCQQQHRSNNAIPSNTHHMLGIGLACHPLGFSLGHQASRRQQPLGHGPSAGVGRGHTFPLGRGGIPGAGLRHMRQIQGHLRAHLKRVNIWDAGVYLFRRADQSNKQTNKLLKQRTTRHIT